MTFLELVAEVISVTKRPDLVDRTKAAVRAATLKVHHSDFYYKDLVEVPVQFDEIKHIQNFTPTDVIPKFRKAKYIRIWNGDVDGDAGRFLKAIQIEDAIDNYNYTKVDVFYMAGILLQIRTGTALHRVLFGAYVHPTIMPEADYASWIATEYPYAIVYEAARNIFSSIGLPEQAGVYANLFAEILSEIRMSSVDDLPVT